MKKLLLLLCCITAFSLSGQNNWQWALAPDSGVLSLNAVEEMALDKNDNILITGNYNFTLAIAGSTLPVSTITPGARSGYTAKINKTGAVQWFQTTSLSYQTAICTDDIGNSYVAGVFGSSLVASSTTLVANPNESALYLLKYAPGGNLLWGKIIGTGIVGRQSMTQVGNKLYLCGSVASTVTPNFTLGSYNFTTQPLGNVYYAQLDTSGVVLSADRFGGFLNNNRSCIAVSPNGNIALSAWASAAPLVIGSQTLAAAVTNTVFNSVVLINISSGGAINWLKRIEKASNLYNNSICSDLSNSIYLASTFNGGSVIVDNDTVTSSIGISGLLIKFDATGGFLWSKTLEGSSCGTLYGDVFCGSVSTDMSGNVSVSGRVSGPILSIGTYTTNNPYISNGCYWSNIFIAQFESTGNTRGVLIGVAENAAPNSLQIKVDSDYNIEVAGHFYGSTLFLGPSTLYGNPNSHVARLFVAKTGGIIKGISSNSPAIPLTVYPIPSTSEVIFTSENNRIRNIMLYDLTGKLLVTKYCDNTNVELSIAELAPGIYNARIETQDGYVKTMKVVKSE